MNLEAPRTLPVVEHLSHSSMKMFLTCPEKWRRRYIEAEYEPTNANLLIGKAVGSGISAGYIGKMIAPEKQAEYQAVMLDVTSDTFDKESQGQEVDWRDDSPGESKDRAIACTTVYADKVAPEMHPETIEQGFEIQLPNVDWKVKGFLDIVGSLPGFLAKLHDVKTVSKADNTLDEDIQATMYVASNYVRDGSLPSYAWHQIKKPLKTTPASVRILTTQRTATQVNNYLERVAQVAREIDWRNQTGNWQGAAPGSWACSEKYCGYWNSCRFGGAK